MKCSICEKRQESLDILNKIKSEFEREKERTNFCVLNIDGNLDVITPGYVEILNECCGVDEDTLDLFKDTFRFKRKREQISIIIEDVKKDVNKLKQRIAEKKDRNTVYSEKVPLSAEEQEKKLKERIIDLENYEKELEKLDMKKAHIIVSTKMDSFDGKSHHHECFTCGKRWPEKGCYDERYVDDCLEG